MSCRAEVVSWTELDHICSLAKDGMHYYGNHMDDDFERVYAVFGDATNKTKKFYCVLLFN